MSLTRDEILNADDREIRAVEVEEWGGTVYVGSMTGAQRDQLEHEMVASEDNPDGKGLLLRAKLAVLTLCDKEGKALFTLADLDALSQKSAAPLDKVFSESADLNHLSKGDQDELTKTDVALGE